MNAAVNTDFNKIFQNIELYPQYQPIVSVVKGKVIGYEGLIRGQNLNGHVQPKDLFAKANETNTVVELDRYCRESILKNFVGKYENHNEHYLFLNIDASIIEKVEGSNYLLDQVIKYKTNPETIVIEIVESQTNDIDKLIKFVTQYRNKGFLIALDDLGTGFSNLERILIIKPDIIKLDRSLIAGIQTDKYKQEFFKSIAKFANLVGTVVVAEGIETEIEAFSALEYGAHLLQGFYFCKPEILDQIYFQSTNRQISRISKGFKNYMVKKVAEDKDEKKQLEKMIAELIDQLSNSKDAEFDLILSRYIDTVKGSMIECVYILNETGRQISNTYFYEYHRDERKKLLFFPASVGTDHSLKEYFYRLVNGGINKYYSETYISLATGNSCATLSIAFKNHGTKNILCIDYQHISSDNRI